MTSDVTAAVDVPRNGVIYPNRTTAPADHEAATSSGMHIVILKWTASSARRVITVVLGGL